MAAVEGRRPRQPRIRPEWCSPLHLARELVRSDADYAESMRQCQWDQAEAWLDYRERLQDWRFDSVRGQMPRHLCICPHCGRVSRLEPGRVQCFACGTYWVTT